MRHQPADLFTCARYAAPPGGVVSVAEIDEGRAARALAEVALCVDHLCGVALALGFEPPGDVRAPRGVEVV